MDVWGDVCVACAMKVGRPPQFDGVGEREVVCLTALALAHDRGVENLRLCAVHKKAFAEIASELNEPLIIGRGAAS